SGQIRKNLLNPGGSRSGDLQPESACPSAVEGRPHQASVKEKYWKHAGLAAVAGDAAAWRGLRRKDASRVARAPMPAALTPFYCYRAARGEAAVASVSRPIVSIAANAAQAAPIR